MAPCQLPLPVQGRGASWHPPRAGARAPGWPAGSRAVGSWGSRVKLLQCQDAPGGPRNLSGLLGASIAPGAVGAPDWVRPPPAPSPGAPWPPTPTREKRLLVSTEADWASSGTICGEGAGGPWPGPRGRRAGRGGLSQDGAQRASRLSQSEERDPEELQDPGVRHGGVSRGPPYQQKSVDPKGPESLLCHRFPTIPFAAGKASRSVF